MFYLVFASLSKSLTSWPHLIITHAHSNETHCTAMCSSRKKEKGGKIAAAFWKSLQQQLVCARIRVDTAPTPVMKCLECLIVWQAHWCHKIYGVTFEFLNSLTMYIFFKTIDRAMTEIKRNTFHKLFDSIVYHDGNTAPRRFRPQY